MAVKGVSSRKPPLRWSYSQGHEKKFFFEYFDSLGASKQVAAKLSKYER